MKIIYWCDRPVNRELMIECLRECSKHSKFGLKRSSFFIGHSFTVIYEAEDQCQKNMATLLEDKTGKLWVVSYAKK